MGSFRNSTFFLPPLSNFDVLEFYITASPASSSDSFAREIFSEIEDNYDQIKTANPDFQSMYGGNTHVLPLRWSLAQDIYTTAVTPTNVTFTGIAIAESSAKLSYIAVPLERAEYDQKNTIDSARIRYLVTPYFPF